jgi:hypothetical protein
MTTVPAFGATDGLAAMVAGIDRHALRDLLLSSDNVGLTRTGPLGPELGMLSAESNLLDFLAHLDLSPVGNSLGNTMMNDADLFPLDVLAPMAPVRVWDSSTILEMGSLDRRFMLSYEYDVLPA